MDPSCPNHADRPEGRDPQPRDAPRAASAYGSHSPGPFLVQACPVTSDNPAVIAMIRYIVLQAARDGDLVLAYRSDEDVRRSVTDLLRDLAGSEWRMSAQLEHDSKLVRAARRFADEGEPELSIVMYATAVEHWLNGMIEVGLRRRGEELNRTSERGSLDHKLNARWRDLFGVEFPEDLRSAVLHLAQSRNDFVHYKWPSRTEDEDLARRSAVRTIAQRAPELLQALDELENIVVFDGERSRLERILDEMALHDILRD